MIRLRIIAWLCVLALGLQPLHVIDGESNFTVPPASVGSAVGQAARAHVRSLTGFAHRLFETLADSLHSVVRHAVELLEECELFGGGRKKKTTVNADLKVLKQNATLIKKATKNLKSKSTKAGAIQRDARNLERKANDLTPRSSAVAVKEVVKTAEEIERKVKTLKTGSVNVYELDKAVGEFGNTGNKIAAKMGAGGTGTGSTEEVDHMSTENAEQLRSGVDAIEEDVRKIVDSMDPQTHSGSKVTEFTETQLPKKLDDVNAKLDALAADAGADTAGTLALPALLKLSEESAEIQAALSELGSSGKDFANRVTLIEQRIRAAMATAQKFEEEPIDPTVVDEVVLTLENIESLGVRGTDVKPIDELAAAAKKELQTLFDNAIKKAVAERIVPSTVAGTSHESYSGPEKKPDDGLEDLMKDISAIADKVDSYDKSVSQIEIYAKSGGMATDILQAKKDLYTIESIVDPTNDRLAETKKNLDTTLAKLSVGGNVDTKATLSGVTKYITTLLSDPTIVASADPVNMAKVVIEHGAIVAADSTNVGTKVLDLSTAIDKLDDAFIGDEDLDKNAEDYVARMARGFFDKDEADDRAVPKLRRKSEGGGDQYSHRKEQLRRKADDRAVPDLRRKSANGGDRYLHPRQEQLRKEERIRQEERSKKLKTDKRLNEDDILEVFKDLEDEDLYEGNTLTQDTARSKKNS